MKNSILSFYFVFAITSIIYGQSLVIENRTWSNTWIGTEHGDHFHSYYIKFEGDIFINNSVYKKIYKSEDESQLTWKLYGYIREDSSKKVFIYDDYYQADQLLFDFDLQLGDSILPPGSPYYLYVCDIRYVTYGQLTDTLKQIDFSDRSDCSRPSMRWIEGIGSPGGILDGLTEYGICCVENHLVCFYENDTLKYSNPGFSTCFPYQTDDYIPNIKYREFAIPGAKWYYSNRENPLGGPEEGYLEIKCIGDTIINNKDSRILRKTYYASDSSVHNLGFEYIYNENRKTYYLVDGKFYLLYDFNAEAGDTLTLREPYFTNTTPDTTFRIVIDRTEIINWGGWLELKAIYSHTITGPWDLFNVQIEKIGNLPYMFPQSSLDCDAQCYDPFRGYLDYDINYWGDGWGASSFEKLINNNSSIKNNIRVNINPNPFYNYITIEGLNNRSKIIELYDIFGRKVYNSIHRESSITIDMSDIESGIYFIRIIEENSNHIIANQMIIKVN